MEKSREFKKNIYFCIFDYAKASVWITTSCGKFLKKWEYQTTLPASWETYMQLKKQELEPNMEQLTSSNPMATAEFFKFSDILSAGL